MEKTSNFILPSGQALKEVLGQAENSATPLKIKSAFRPLLQSILPEKYGNYVPGLKSTVVRNIESLSNKVIVMLSGGLGSTTSLWKVLKSELDFEICHVEGMYDKDLDIRRRKLVARILYDGRRSDGYPLTMNKNIFFSLNAPNGSHKLSRRSRIAIMISLVRKKLVERGINQDEFPTLVWGNVSDCIQVFDATQSWGFRHLICTSDSKSCIFTLAEAETISDSVRELYITKECIISPCEILPKNITNKVCSCWSCQLDTKIPYEPRSKIEERDGNIYESFLSMCSRCDGCKRYIDAWKKICIQIPKMRIGSWDLQSRDDHRHFENIPTLLIEKKNNKCFSEFILDRKEIKEKRRGKKKKVEQENEEEDKDEEEEELDNVEEMATILLADDKEYNEPIEEQDPIEDDDQSIEFNFEDSDGEKENKKKKRKIM